MRKIWILFLFSILSIKTFATHEKGGEITYTHLTGLNYKITVTTYTNTDPATTQADRCQLIVYFGDGDSALVNRINGTTYNLCGSPTPDGEMVAAFTKKNIYEIVHTYSGYGHYIITMEDPNSIAGICNIPNSVNAPFFLETEVFIDPSVFTNNSPEFVSIPIFYALVDTIYTQNVTAYDPDVDALTYQLVPCKGSGGLPVTGYTLPSGFSIDSLTGEITWNMPTMICIYNFAVKVNKWRNGAIIGYVIRDFQIYTVANTTGVNEYSKKPQDIFLYPNPASDKIIVSKLNNDLANSLFIYDVTGRFIKSVFLTGSSPEIDITDLTDGFYNYEIGTSKNIIARGKFVKN